MLAKPLTRPLAPGVTTASLTKVLRAVEKLAEELPSSETMLAQEIRQAIRLLRAACHRGLAVLGGGLASPQTRQALELEGRDLMAEHARVWLLRNREGGLRDSLARMATALRQN